ncbi:hypothetical protein [Acetobacter thailandicus]|uniref:hypothetical protein n=1 Tax=Acetobacter thailandicus TaxID=1502842 RepID=UPI001BAA92DE|nr:hypothetical protein [Acetobacter thailandicus]MBS0961208.1 hypothetical protein [Acetobacter thailandicus]
MTTILSSRGWLPKVSAASLAGAVLTMGLTGVVGCLSGSDSMPRSMSAQFLMWLAVLVWVALLGSCFLFRSGRQAWLVLTGANILVWGVYVLARAAVL